MKMPMIITSSRLILIPVFILLFYLPFHWAHIVAAVIFAVAGITDWLDGYLARKLNQISRFGAFLDPVADKLIVVIALVLLTAEPRMHYISLAAAIIVGREVAVSALREWMAEIGKRASVAVAYISKIKTAMQIISIVILLVSEVIKFNWVIYLGYFMLYLSAGLTLWTMWMYLKTAWPNFEFEK